MSDDRVWRRLMRRLSSRNEHVRVGVLSDQGGDETLDGGGITMAGLAAVHEFGSDSANIPQRSFIFSTVEKTRRDQQRLLAKLAKRVVEGTMTKDQALAVLGEWGVKEIKKTISSSVPPPLQPATIERKGSSKTLVDTGRLRDSITWAVEKE